MNKQSIEALRNDIARSLYQAALAYYRSGLEVFYKARNSSWQYYQPAVGNLCIAIELLLKSMVAKRSLRDLYKNLPLEAQIYFTNPELLPEVALFRRYAIDIQSHTYKTLEFDECISFFYMFCPEVKQKFRPYFAFLSKTRNVCIHAAFPAFQKYDLYRVAYITMEFFGYLVEHNELLTHTYDFKNKNEDFLKEYDEQRIERVRKEIENAKDNSKKLAPTSPLTQDSDEWDKFVTTCPICKCDGVLYGYTDLNSKNAQDWGDVALEFLADSFICKVCALKLLDQKELELAGMKTHYDRSEDMEKWLQVNSLEDY